MIGDVNGDGRDDFVIWRPGNNKWYAMSPSTGSERLVQNLSWGNSGLGDIPLVGDVSGDGKADFVIWRPGTGKWYARDKDERIFERILQGKSGDIPLLGDVSADGQQNLISWRKSTGGWYAAGRRYALCYRNTSDVGPGRPSRQEFDKASDDKPGCRGQGGYWFAPFEMAGFAATFDGTEDLVSSETRALMYDPSDPDERLAWNQDDASNAFISNVYGVPRLAWHGGADRTSYSAFVQLPDGYYAFGNINSPILDARGQPKRGQSRLLFLRIQKAWTVAVGGGATRR